MTQASTSPPAHAVPSGATAPVAETALAAAAAPQQRAAPGVPLARERRFTLAPNWLQVALIVGLLGAAVFVALNERYLWSALLALAGMSFGASYVLRRMVGDDYDRA